MEEVSVGDTVSFTPDSEPFTRDGFLSCSFAGLQFLISCSSLGAILENSGPDCELTVQVTSTVPQLPVHATLVSFTPASRPWTLGDLLDMPPL